jgi:hypothetical protein
MLSQSKEDMNDRFLTASKFESIIDKMVHESDYTYVEAILEYCEENSLDPEDTVKYINTNLKKKIEVEAIMHNYLPKKSTLQFEMED